MTSTDSVERLTGSRSHILRAAILCLLLALVAAAIPFSEGVYLFTLVAAMFACVLTPLWYDWHKGRLDLFAPIHVIGGIYFIYFGLGSLWSVADPEEMAQGVYLIPYIPQALLVVVLGYLALLAGYYFSSGSLGHSKPEEHPRGVSLLGVCGVVGGGGFVAAVMWTGMSSLGASSGGLLTSAANLAPLFLFAWAALWILHQQGRATRNQVRLLFAVMLPLALILAYLFVSNKSMFLTLVGVPIIARWYARRRIPWLPVALLIPLMLFVIFPFYNTYRITARTETQTARMSQTYETVQNWDSEAYRSRSIGLFKRRMALITSMAVVVRDVGHSVPVANGEMLVTPFLTFMVPRPFWPDKPLMTFGQDVARTFGFTHALDRQTAIALTVPGELYWNFEILGVIVGMGLYGVGLRYLYRRYASGDRLDPIRGAIYIVLLIRVVDLDGGLPVGLATILRTALLLEVVRGVGKMLKLIEVRRPDRL